MYKPVSEEILADELSQLPLKQFEGKIILIDSPQKLTNNLAAISSHKMLGFDTETKPSFKKGQVNTVCLIQLANNEVCYLIRLNRTGFPKELLQILCNSNIIKVGVALKDDLHSLYKLSYFKHGGFIDLQDYVEKFGIIEKSLKKLAARVLGIRISKSQQTSNWEIDSLSEPQLLYAATDAWVCYEIYERLKMISSS